MVTRAKVDIARGEELTLHYQGGMKGRMWRQKGLRAGWYFTCTCRRCCSADELGTEMSTLRSLEIAAVVVKSSYSCQLASVL